MYCKQKKVGKYKHSVLHDTLILSTVCGREHYARTVLLSDTCVTYMWSKLSPHPGNSESYFGVFLILAFNVNKERSLHAELTQNQNIPHGGECVNRKRINLRS